LKTQVHQTLGKEGVIPELDDIFRGSGPRWLDDLQLGDVYLERIESLRELIELHDRQIRHCDARIHRRLKGHPGYEAVQVLRGVGPVLAAVFVAEIGDVSRFDNPRRLCSWAGLTPRLRESAHSHRGHITKQGWLSGVAPLVSGSCRWAGGMEGPLEDEHDLALHALPEAGDHESLRKPPSIRGVRIEGCFNRGGVECAGEGLLALGVDLVLEHGGDSFR
jgi:hypothetical protein